MDYLDRSYFTVLTTKVKTVLDKIGAAPWYEPALYNKMSALTTEEVHDNFQALVAGELNLNTRVKTVEDSIVDVTQNVSGGSLLFNGFKEKSGCFYGGRPFNFLAPTDLDGDINTEVNLSNPNDASFSIAEGNGIVYSVNKEVNNETTLWYTVLVDATLSKPNLITYLNEALVNNRTPFAFVGVDLSSPGTRLDWGTTPKTFSISFNDEPFKTVFLQANTANAGAAATYIRDRIREAFPAYTAVFDVTTVGNSVITLTANSSSAANRLTRVRIKEDPGMDVLGTANGIGWISTGSEKSIFDFSNSLEFYLSGNKVGIRGKGAYSYFVIKDDSTKSLFPTLKLDATIRKDPPFFQIAHTPYPADVADPLPLSYSGAFYVSKLISAGAITGPIVSSLADIDVLNVATLNASTVSIPNADIALSRVTSKGLYIKPTASSVNSTIYDALDGGIYVEGVATLAHADITLADVATLTVSGNTSLNDATIDNLTANTASITSLTVTGGSLNVASISSTSINSVNASVTNLAVNDLIVSKTSKATGRLYTIALQQGIDSAPPTSNNTQAVSLAYDGWFAATKVHAGSVELTSLRAMKKDITQFTDSALDIINNTSIVNFKYKHDDTVPHIGFIADDSHELLATPSHNTMEIGNSIGLLLKAVQELSSEVELLKRKTN